MFFLLGILFKIDSPNSLRIWDTGNNQRICLKIEQIQFSFSMGSNLNDAGEISSSVDHDQTAL